MEAPLFPSWWFSQVREEHITVPVSVDESSLAEEVLCAFLVSFLLLFPYIHRASKLATSGYVPWMNQRRSFTLMKP